MRSPPRYSLPSSRRCLKAVTWSVRQRPGRARRPPSRFPSSSGYSGKAGRQSRSPWCSSRRASSRCRSVRRFAATGTIWVCVFCRFTAASQSAVSWGRSSVATTGRALDHINRGTLKLSGLEVVVLDEADEMLDMGFAEEIEAILAGTPGERQTALFSATMPPRIDGMVRRHLRDPVRVELGRRASASADGLLVRQTAYLVPRGHKAAALGRVLDLERPTAAIVFCRTRDEVDQLTESLNGRGYRAEALHGGMDQKQRDRVMARLRSRAIDLLVATDVAAR